MLDVDLADLYEVPTKALNQAVRRNLDRFPSDFMFQLTKEEFSALNRSQFVTCSQKRTFVRLRQILTSNAELARKLNELE